jgi:hypothetical protein
MKKLVVAITVFFITCAVAQPQPQGEAPPPPKWGWKHSVVSSLTMTQVSFRDWAQGGEDALAWTARLDGKSTLDDTTYSWGNSYKMVYGQAKIGTTKSRKTEDRIEFESVLTYKLGTYVNPYVGTTLKTQFSAGVTVDANGNETPVSKFFDPGYLTQSAGVGYQPAKEVKTRFGVALREIVTSVYWTYANDPNTPPQDRVKTRVDGGLESVTDIDWKLDDNLLFRSKLELFAPIKKPSDATLRMDNTLTASVSKYVVVILNVQLINDERASTRLQVKEVLSLGLTYTLF